VLRGRITQDTGAKLLSRLLTIGVRLVDPRAGHIYRLANMHNIAVYDAAYLALAEALGCQLWTGDRHFYQAVYEKAPQVRWIGDYPLPEQGSF